MYCTINDIKSILPKNIKIGNQNLGTPVPGAPELNRDHIDAGQLSKYIRFATQEIDGRLKAYYVCPLRKVNIFQTDVMESITSGDDVEIHAYSASNFINGQTVRINNGIAMETAIVKDTIDDNALVLNKVVNDYDIFDGDITISIISFPEPISIIAARLAVSYAFDPLFSAEQSPDTSQYGIEQRKLAINSIDSILTGAILLFGQDHTGKRFVRGSVHDAYQNPSPDLQFGREKS
jgi:hypothetical protein